MFMKHEILIFLKHQCLGKSAVGFFMSFAVGSSCTELQVEMPLQAQMLLLNVGVLLEPLWNKCCFPKSQPPAAAGALPRSREALASQVLTQRSTKSCKSRRGSCRCRLCPEGCGDPAEVLGENWGWERSPRLAEETQNGNRKNWQFGHFSEVQQSWRKGRGGSEEEQK